MKPQLKLVCAVAAAMILGNSSAMAAEETGTLTVTATVDGACSIGDGTLAFGSFNSVSVDSDGTLGSTANKDTNTAIDVVCTNGTTGTVTVSDGAHAGPIVDGDIRRMSDGSTHFLNYHLYSDSYTTEIPADDEATTAYTITGDGTEKEITIYGRIEAEDITNQPLGSYTDSVTLTVSY